MTKFAPAMTAALAIFVLCACATPASASPSVAGIDLGPASRITPAALALPAGEGHEAGTAGATVQLVHQGHDHIHASGTVNSIDEAGCKINLSHGPIPQVGWPAMTMDFAVAPSVDLKSIAPGSHVDFTLEKGPDGLFQVESLTPASEGK